MTCAVVSSDRDVGLCIWRERVGTVIAGFSLWVYWQDSYSVVCWQCWNVRLGGGAGKGGGGTHVRNAVTPAACTFVVARGIGKHEGLEFSRMVAGAEKNAVVTLY
jgi:hypothetical protein